MKFHFLTHIRKWLLGIAINERVKMLIKLWMRKASSSTKPFLIFLFMLLPLQFYNKILCPTSRPFLFFLLPELLKRCLSIIFHNSNAFAYLASLVFFKGNSKTATLIITLSWMCILKAAGT